MHLKLCGSGCNGIAFEKLKWRVASVGFAHFIQRTIDTILLNGKPHASKTNDCPWNWTRNRTMLHAPVHVCSRGRNWVAGCLKIDETWKLISAHFLCIGFFSFESKWKRIIYCNCALDKWYVRSVWCTGVQCTPHCVIIIIIIYDEMRVWEYALPSTWQRNKIR